MSVCMFFGSVSSMNKLESNLFDTDGTPKRNFLKDDFEKNKQTTVHM